MGVKATKRYCPLKSIMNGAKLFPIFLLYGPHNVDFLGFLNLCEFKFNVEFSFPLTWEPMVVKI